MNAVGQARIDRFVDWLRTNIPHLVSEGQVDARLFVAEAVKRDLKGDYSYWQGQFTKQKGRSFGAKKAREVEDAFNMRPHSLEGAAFEWPFTEQLGAAVSKLSRDDLWHAEVSLRAHLKLPIPEKPPGGFGSHIPEFGDQIAA
jgi:hypothetical protein